MIPNLPPSHISSEIGSDLLDPIINEHVFLYLSYAKWNDLPGDKLLNPNVITLKRSGYRD